MLGRGYIVRPEADSVVVVGGAVLDTKVRTAFAPVLGTSNPGTASATVGGVGRNIAENLARLGRPTCSSPRSATTRRATPCCNAPPPPASSAGTSWCRRTPPAPTPPCSTTAATCTSRWPTCAPPTSWPSPTSPSCRRLLGGADALVVDANLDATVIRWLLSAAQDAGVRSVFEPVSVAKATAAAPVLDGSVRVHTVTPNVDELAALVGHPVADTVDDVRAAADVLHARGVEHVWVRRGTRGSLLSTPPATGDAGSRAVLVGAPAVDVADVTGAGDSMTAGYVHALLDGADVVEAARYGQALAALTCASADTVRADLTAALVAAHLTPTQPPTEELTR